MKPAVLKKVRDIKGRVRDLRACFVTQIKASKVAAADLKTPDDRLVPRVSGIVIREGRWLAGLVRRVSQRGQYEFLPATKSDLAEDQMLTNAEVFFGELAEQHADEIKKNNFIYRVDAEFITYLEKMVLLFEKINALTAAKIAAVATIDDDEGTDADAEAEIAAEMTM